MDITFAIGRANTVSQHIPQTKDNTGPTISHVHKGYTNDEIESDEEDDPSKTPLSATKESSLPPWSRIFFTVIYRMFSISTEETVPFTEFTPAAHTHSPTSADQPSSVLTNGTM
jgi:hypothetical protein